MAEAIVEVVLQWGQAIVRRAVVGSGIVQSTVSLDAVISGLHVFKAFSIMYVVREVCMFRMYSLVIIVNSSKRGLSGYHHLLIIACQTNNNIG